jgi:hypothetical protein
VAIADKHGNSYATSTYKDHKHHTVYERNNHNNTTAFYWPLLLSTKHSEPQLERSQSIFDYMQYNIDLPGDDARSRAKEQKIPFTHHKKRGNTELAS